VNPHARLDYQRWFAESAADYIRLQAETLRQHTKDQWVTTNFMTFHEPIVPALSGKDLEIVTSTMYPVAGYFNEPPLGFRMGDGAGVSIQHDYMRGINGQFGVMELQPGQVNWGTVNPRPLPGVIRAWILRAFALGAKLVCTYRYRQPLFGGELYHHGIVGTDGVTPSPGGKEYVQAIEDVKLLRKSAPASAAEPKEYAARRTAILYSADNRWDLDNHKQTVRWDTLGHLMRYYAALKSLGSPVDVIGEDKDLSRYPFVVAPAYQLVDEALVARWKAYVEAGGHLVLSCRTGQKDRMGQLREGPWAAAITELVGADVTGYDVLPEPFKGRVAAQGKSYEWGVWADLLAPRPGAETLATYADQFYAGAAAAVRRPLGKGSVTYVGVESLSGALEKDLLRMTFNRAGVAVRDLPAQFFVDWRDGFWVATNFSSVPVAAPVPSSARLLVGARNVPPAGVAVWTDQ
jgi:beta-galactosidase